VQVWLGENSASILTPGPTKKQLLRHLWKEQIRWVYCTWRATRHSSCKSLIVLLKIFLDGNIVFYGCGFAIPWLKEIAVMQ